MTTSPNVSQPILPRVGIGTDVHAYAELESTKELWVGGARFMGERPLDGHSDGDVVAHAAADALFSAAGLGDLGSNFGTSEPEWAGAAGSKLLQEAAARVRAAGLKLAMLPSNLLATAQRSLDVVANSTKR